MLLFFGYLGIILKKILLGLWAFFHRLVFEKKLFRKTGLVSFSVEIMSSHHNWVLRE
jgi:hypothetical protein